MKKILSIFFVLLFLTGCAKLNLNKSSVTSKKDLIEQANNGSIKAMLELNKHYFFPDTKQGLKLYRTWYKNIDKSDKPSEIFEIAKVYEKYKEYFINGEEKSLKLFQLAYDLGEKEALIYKSEKLIESYNMKEALKLKDKSLETLNDEELKLLYMAFFNNKRLRYARDIEAMVEDRGIKLPFEVELRKLKKSRYRKDQKEYFDNLIKEVISSKDAIKIEKLADTLREMKRYKDAIKAYKRVIKLNKANKDAYYWLGNIYSSIYKVKDTKQSIKYLKKAALLNHKEATIKLLRKYSKGEETLTEFFELKNKLEKTQEGKLILAKYYEKERLKTRQLLLLDELAKANNHEAIVELALLRKKRYKFDPQRYKIRTYWKEYVKKTSDKKLENRYIKALEDKYRLSRVLKQELIDYYEKQSAKGRIAVNIKLYNHYRYKDKSKAIDFLKKAYEAGDVKSAYELIKEFKYGKNKDYGIVIEVYKNLAKRGDRDALRELAKLYTNPPNFPEAKKHMNVEKGLEIYKEMADNGNIEALKELAELYICGNCFEDEKNRYDDSFSYIKKLHDMDYPRYTYLLGWLYNYGKGVKQDPQKALELYKEAMEENYKYAAYRLGWLYFPGEDNKNKKYVLRVDYDEAIKYFKLGAEFKDYKSSELLGYIYEKGIGVQKDEKKAFKYYQKAARHSYTAAYKVGMFFKEIKRYKDAFKYFEKAAYRNTDASIELGIMYEKGLYKEKKSTKKALKYYQLAYNKSQSGIAAYNIGLLFEYGKGEVNKSEKLAKFWYKKSDYKKAKERLEALNNKKDK